MMFIGIPRKLRPRKGLRSVLRSLQVLGSQQLVGWSFRPSLHRPGQNGKGGSLNDCWSRAVRLKAVAHDAARRLARESDAGLKRFSGALLSLDGFFIAVFSANRIYAATYDHTSILGYEWHIGRDRSYAEMLGYLKMTCIVFVLISIRGKWQRPIYLALILIFTVALLDDALRLHERLGDVMVDAFALHSFAGRMSPHFGELIVWMILGVFLVAAAGAAFVRSPREDRHNGLLLMGAFAVLVLFAVVVDLMHAVVTNKLGFPGADLLFTVIEDGGEQVVLTLTCGLAVLIRRELRSREAS